MVNLRYHIVSIVAVFLALALGIVVGSTVIDKAIVDTLNDRVNVVERRANETAAENRGLNDQLDSLRDFAQQARDQLVAGELAGVPVLVVTVQGVDRRPIDGLVDGLRAAAAVPTGTVSFTNKFLLASEADVRALADVVGLPTTLTPTPPVTQPDGVRRLALSRVASLLDGTGNDPGLLPALASAGFVSYEPPPGQSGTTTGTTPGRSFDLRSFPVPGLRVVVVSGAAAQVADDLVARPFVASLARSSPALPTVVAAEDRAGGVPGTPGFVEPLRDDGSLSSRLSTVDNLGEPTGQAAAVLALRDLATPRTGHYGVGPGAQRQIPATQT